GRCGQTVWIASGVPQDGPGASITFQARGAPCATALRPALHACGRFGACLAAASGNFAPKPRPGTVTPRADPARVSADASPGPRIPGRSPPLKCIGRRATARTPHGADRLRPAGVGAQSATVA